MREDLSKNKPLVKGSDTRLVKTCYKIVQFSRKKKKTQLYDIQRNTWGEIIQRNTGGKIANRKCPKSKIISYIFQMEKKCMVYKLYLNETINNVL